ncbi:MAG: hypothetical protein GF381_02355 [Candidatus Pacebacteria bacterium]|nr:hypothetical protein [Candidatus Paceibacterota bacterium]
MAIKNAANANLWIVDQHLKQVAETEGVEILESPQAWQMHSWTREYFDREPKKGYFVWVKDQPSCPFFSCVNIKQAKHQQNLQNLVVIDPGLTVKIGGVCSALSLKLNALHQAQGKIIIKQGSKVEYDHVHRWGKGDVVAPNYEFYLEESAQIDYTYKTNKTPLELSLINKFYVQQKASVRLNIVADLEQTKFDSLDEIHLLGKGSAGISNLRFVSRSGAQVRAQSKMVAQEAATGHLDCQSLNLAPDARVSLVPEVMVNHPQAQITHEASIGRVSEDQLNYLRMRGLTEKEAVNLIASGFINI